MKQVRLDLPELGMIIATRAMLGAGIALLLADVVQLGDPQRYSLVKFRISRISALSPFKSGLTPCQEAGWSGRKLISIVSLALRDDFLQVSPMLFTSDLLSEQSESVLSCLMFTASTPPYVGFQQPFSIRATTY
jgi:hypothetical protein